jgi:PadR family transcriptional regulator
MGSDVYTGTLDMVILRALRGGPLHGYGVGRWIRETSGEVLRIEEGALYPAMHRLEKKKLIAAKWGETDLGRPAKFYRLTATGRRMLSREEARWREHAAAVEALLSAEGGA